MIETKTETIVPSVLPGQMLYPSHTTHWPGASVPPRLCSCAQVWVSGLPPECQWCPVGSGGHVTTKCGDISIMYDAELMAVATGAAGTLVAAIASSGAERMRVKVAHFFRRGTPGQQLAAAQAVDETAAQLASPSAEGQALAADVWVQLIAQHLAAHRDAMNEVDELAVPTPKPAKVRNQHNTGTGTFIGGDVHGGMTFNYGGASDGGR